MLFCFKLFYNRIISCFQLKLYINFFLKKKVLKNGLNKLLEIPSLKSKYLDTSQYNRLRVQGISWAQSVDWCF